MLGVNVIGDGFINVSLRVHLLSKSPITQTALIKMETDILFKIMSSPFDSKNNPIKAEEGGSYSTIS